MIANTHARLSRLTSRAALAIAGFVFLASLAQAAEPVDPFSDDNAVKRLLKNDKALLPAKADATNDLVRFNVTVEPKEVRRGQTFKLTITGTPAEGYHTYPITQRSEDPIQSEDSLSRITYNPPSGLKPLEPLTESDVDPVERPTGVYVEFNKTFTWSQDVLVLPDATPGMQKLPFTIKFQVCNEKRCVPGKPRFDPVITVSNAPAVPLTAELENRVKEEPATILVVQVPDDLKAKMSAALKDKAKVPAAAKPNEKEAKPEAVTAVVEPFSVLALLQHVLLAFGGGFAMLLTPCVFPMIPVTVSFFLKQGEKEHHRPFTLALVYSGTIIVVITFGVLILGNVILQLANNVWLNLAMGAILTLFALSLFGMFELELPHFLVNFTSAREGKGGYIGAFFMALTFTINSFTCTAPFLGPLLSGVARAKISSWELVLLSLAYSAAFALPFFVLALFPRLLKTLPKSGGWLNSVKVVMGFLEIALALKFLSIADAGLFPGKPRLFNYDTVLCTWMALSVACGLYLLGFFRLPHDTPEEYVGVPRLLLACFMLGLAVYMTPLLDRKKPLGAVGELLVAWLPADNPQAPPVLSPGEGDKPAIAGHLDWYRDYEKAWTKAKAEKKLLFIDFTGVNCINCRFNEINVFSRADVKAEIAKFVRVQLYTDVVPDPALSRAEASKEAERNLAWQSKTFDDVSLPLYVILDPATASKPFTDDGKLAGLVKGKEGGTIQDVPEFVAMIQKAQGKQVAMRK